MRDQHRPERHYRRFSILLVFAFAIFVPLGFAFDGLADFDLSGRYVMDLNFRHDQDQLAGSLVLPNENHDGPIAILIHGDGPQNRFSNDAYLPLINALLDRGIGIYSWDKPGIGQSSGNWLDQSIPDRGAEAAEAFDLIASTRPAQADKIGFLGFSQAGWVIPKASARINALAFNVIVGGAINWQDQGAFYTRQRLLAAGKTDDEITAHITQSRLHDAAIFAPDADHQTYLAQTTDEHPMNADRYGFVKRNITVDARPDLVKLDAPTLALFGADDLNVDARNDAQIYRDVIGTRNRLNDVVVITGATHGLLRSGLFNYQLASEMPIERQVLFTAMGRNAYVPGVHDRMANWIKLAAQSD